MNREMRLPQLRRVLGMSEEDKTEEWMRNWERNEGGGDVIEAIRKKGAKKVGKSVVCVKRVRKAGGREASNNKGVKLNKGGQMKECVNKFGTLDKFLKKQ